MKLFYAPGACSIGIHVLLEEVGKPYELHKLNLQQGDQFKPPMSDINPKSKVPTLQRDDGKVITEFPVIAHWLGATFPEANLLPEDPEQALQAAETLDFCVATVHMQGFSRIIRPSNFAPSEADHDKVKARGMEIIDKSFGILAKEIGSNDYVAGPFSVADAALFYVEFWASRRDIATPAPLKAHFARMMARPSVKATLEQEGLAA